MSTTPETPRRFRFEVYRDQCAACGLEYDSEHSSEYGEPILYRSMRGEIRFVDPDADPVWQEARDLVAPLAQGAGLVDVDEADVFHALMRRTIDPSTPDDFFVSPRGLPPCPRCGSQERARFGTYSPPRFQERTIRPATHVTWSALNLERKQALAREAFRERIGREPT